MTEQQPELLAVPTPSGHHPGRCRVPTRYGAERPCPNPAEGVAAEWTAPLDPAQAIGACRSCADLYRLAFEQF